MEPITQAKMFVRSLSKGPAKILLTFILARSALDVQEIQEWTGMKRETIYAGLKILQEFCMVNKQVVAHGRIVWLPAADVFPGFLQMSEMGTPALPQVSVSGTSEHPDVPIRDTSLVVEESTLTLNTDSSFTTERQVSVLGTSEKFVFPAVADILAQTHLLFNGSTVISTGLEDRDPLDVLAWCLYAFTQKKLTGPGGLVRNRLLKNEQPPEWARHEWSEKLPANFLEALGLIDYICEECQQVFLKSTELDQHMQAQHPEPVLDEDLVAPIVEEDSTALLINERMTAEQAWQSVLDLLQTEMPRASFDTWVRDSMACRYDGNALTVGVRNAYARDWLESRIQSTAERLLVGVLNCSVHVEFVTLDPAKVKR